MDTFVRFEGGGLTVYAYHERITSDFERLSDQQWAKGLQSGRRPAETPWLEPVLAR